MMSPLSCHHPLGTRPQQGLQCLSAGVALVPAAEVFCEWDVPRVAGGLTASVESTTCQSCVHQNMPLSTRGRSRPFESWWVVHTQMKGEELTPLRSTAAVVQLRVPLTQKSL